MFTSPARADGAPSITARRLGNGPVIYPGMPGLQGDLGTNIDGPAVIKAPQWLKHPLGKYYMYFAHHRGTYIRLAYADAPAGPWHVYVPGTLKLSQTKGINHVASPSVIDDAANKRLILYFHSPIEDPDVRRPRPYAQETFIATSTDGLHFTPVGESFGAPYLKAFRYGGFTYGIAMADKKSAYPAWKRSGQFFRSATGFQPFEAGPRVIDQMRHAGILLRGDRLHLFYTLVGDTPERIYHATVDLKPDWTEWTATAPEEVLRPEKDYEGADMAEKKSIGGMSESRERALRDPDVLDDNGHIYLYYTVAGELGIAVAEVTLPPEPAAPQPRD